MTVVDLYVLCGGLGTRLKPFTDKTPKAMVPIAGKPFIAHQLDLLRTKGFRKVCLCIGVFGDQIVNYVDNGSEFGIEVVYSHDGVEPIGTYAAIAKAVHKYQKHKDGSVPIIYGDSYLCADLQNVKNIHDTASASMTMTFCQSFYEEEKPNVFVDGNRLRYEKGLQRPNKPGFIDYGFSIFKGHVFDQAHRDLADCQMHLSDIGDCSFVYVPEPYFEVGTELGVDRLEKFFNT